jgi:seryl-tRNA synthetase
VDIGTVLSERRGVGPTSTGNVIEEAVDRGWIHEFAKGQYVYSKNWTRLVRRLQEELVARAASLGFEEWLLPRLIPADAMRAFQLTQYTPDLLVEASAPSRDSYLDPVQCVGLYHMLRGARIAAESLPLRVVETLGGWTWRNEPADRLDGPYRAVEFNRVEHIYVGSPDQVRALRNAVRDSVCELLADLGLSWQVVVGAGCMEIPVIELARKEANHMDDVPVQDLEVPIRGTLRPDPRRPPEFAQKTHRAVSSNGQLRIMRNDAFYLDTDELAGCSVEGAHLCDQFDIRAERGAPLWSGCCGIGLNRLIVAFLYQHGFDDRNWPDTQVLN